MVNDNRQTLISIGKLLWDKDLASGLNGNISVRLDDGTIVMTGHGTCLGFLEEKDIVVLGRDGSVQGKGQASTEKLLHTEIYKNFPDIKAIIHTHTPLTNGYFLSQDVFVPKIFEAKICLGTVKGVKQSTPAVTDVQPVISQLKSNNIVVLQNHGVVAMGKSLFDCFILIQGLEEAIKSDAVARLYQVGESPSKVIVDEVRTKGKAYALFSQEQIDAIVRIVNADQKLKELGEKSQMTMDLAVKLNETGQVYSFSFQNGSIAKVGNDEKAEFLISAPANIWRAVFNREIDPFVATTQKKMDLRGDFAKISKWYAPCSRIFELWQRVPVE